MSEAIPLGSALSVEFIRVVVHDALYQRLDSVLKLLTVEPRLLRDIEWKAKFILVFVLSIVHSIAYILQRNDLSSFDLRRSSLDPFRGQQV